MEAVYEPGMLVELSWGGTSTGVYLVHERFDLEAFILHYIKVVAATHAPMVTPDIIRKLIADGYISMCAVHSIHLGYWSTPELSGKIPAPREARYVEACMVHEDCASDIGLGVACAAGTRKDAMQALVAITGAVKVTEIEPSNTRTRTRK